MERRIIVAFCVASKTSSRVRLFVMVEGKQESVAQDLWNFCFFFISFLKLYSASNDLLIYANLHRNNYNCRSTKLKDIKSKVYKEI